MHVPLYSDRMRSLEGKRVKSHSSNSLSTFLKHYDVIDILQLTPKTQYGILPNMAIMLVIIVLVIIAVNIVYTYLRVFLINYLSYQCILKIIKYNSINRYNFQLAVIIFPMLALLWVFCIVFSNAKQVSQTCDLSHCHYNSN